MDWEKKWQWDWHWSEKRKWQYDWHWSEQKKWHRDWHRRENRKWQWDWHWTEQKKLQCDWYWTEWKKWQWDWHWKKEGNDSDTDVRLKRGNGNLTVNGLRKLRTFKKLVLMCSYIFYINYISKRTESSFSNLIFNSKDFLFSTNKLENLF